MRDEKRLDFTSSLITRPSSLGAKRHVPSRNPRPLRRVPPARWRGARAGWREPGGARRRDAGGGGRVRLREERDGALGHAAPPLAAREGGRWADPVRGTGTAHHAGPGDARAAGW